MNLSPEQLISCDRKKNQGCKGGYLTVAIDYAKKEGLADLECLPYKEEDKCKTEDIS